MALSLDDPIIIKALIDGVNRRYRAGWGQARMIASCFSKDAKTIEYPWEHEQIEYTEEQRQRDIKASLEAARRMHPDIEIE